ncbi:hypothetical protein BO94DRAFT_580576 [Aspergillus sclerotioniger CBS 115572]|uniref:Mid2 domain-containing protein n=1 Tax=Aspergillus sclerotioniger CBS 115572 TaxID=1450535 RepID=A0A317XDW8_9EURO|nr:hypothetical protein BO94DRAFT_580576 [Aspergillus sclerotioniger CBS 115572]PWY96744.1 hypothetical protein BO94DRAFT_580576 [Aspergillus sclerotioniger CBS 115572]
MATKTADNTAEGSKTSVVTVTRIVESCNLQRAKETLGLRRQGHMQPAVRLQRLQAVSTRQSVQLMETQFSIDRVCQPITIKKGSTATNDWNVTGYWCLQSSAPNILYRTLVGTMVQDATPLETIVLSAPTRTVHNTTTGTTSGIEPSYTSTSFSPTITSAITSAVTSAEGTTGGSPGSHSNTGAIAGGVVGGVVGAAFLVAAGLFVMKRRKKKEAEMREIGTEYRELGNR